jgi:hypothetical protein
MIAPELLNVWTRTLTTDNTVGYRLKRSVRRQMAMAEVEEEEEMKQKAAVNDTESGGWKRKSGDISMTDAQVKEFRNKGVSNNERTAGQFQKLIDFDSTRKDLGELVKELVPGSKRMKGRRGKSKSVSAFKWEKDGPGEYLYFKGKAKDFQVYFGWRHGNLGAGKLDIYRKKS